MPIRLITGKPGNGKTLLMVAQMVLEAGKKDGKRPLYQCGINGMKPGIAEEFFDAREWNAVDPNGEPTCKCTASKQPHAHVIPDGAIIYVDEAWKWFGHLTDASRQATPPAVLQLAEHRHRGIDFVWTAQGPNQLFPFVRPLIAEHTHLVRSFGAAVATKYEWPELNEDVKSEAKRAIAQRSTFLYPSVHYGDYKSASQHTIKTKLPRRVWLIPICLVSVLATGYLAFQYMKPSSVAARVAGKEAPAGTAGAPALDNMREKKPLTLQEYLDQQRPRIPAQPWSAPMYDSRQATTDPQMLCAISGAGKASSCHCYTEQVTPYLGLTDYQCRSAARYGVYNPYRQIARGGQWEQRQQSVQQRPAAYSPPMHGSADRPMTDVRGYERAWLSEGYKAPPMDVLVKPHP